jgi:hypothetical protein
MSERMTSINLPGNYGSGYTDYGHKTVAEMVALIRNHAELMKRDAEAVLAAKDSDFYIFTYSGKNRRNLVVLQEGEKVK